jgi:Zn-dependent protease
VGAAPGHAVTALIGLVLLVVFVAVHEAGHAAAARWVGLEVDGIYLHLFPVTYVATASPRKELIVALAGPVASLVLGLSILGVGLLVAPSGLTGRSWLHDPWLLAGGVNLAMGVLNLVPVLPADGGRALRAALTLQVGRQRSTRVVRALGVALGFALAAASLALVALPWAAWLAALGLYVAFVSARA